MVFLPDRRVPASERRPHQPRGQTADQEHPLSRRQGLPLGPRKLRTSS